MYHGIIPYWPWINLIRHFPLTSLLSLLLSFSVLHHFPQVFISPPHTFILAKRCAFFKFILILIILFLLAHLPLRSPTNPTRKEVNMPPMEKIATDNDQYMTTSGCCSAAENPSSSVPFSDRTVAFSDHTPKDRP